MLLELRLIMIRKRQLGKLNKENLEAFKRIEGYMYNSYLALYEKEEVLQQVLDTMLQAQDEGKSVNLFLGQDHKKFCDSVISEYNNTKSYVLKIIGFIEEAILYIFLGMLFDMIFYKAPVFQINTIVIMMYLSIISEPFYRKSRKENIYPTTVYLPDKKKFPPILIAIILAIPYTFITNKVLSFFSRKYVLDVSNEKFNLYSIRHLLVIGIMLISAIEIYKSISNKQRMS